VTKYIAIIVINYVASKAGAKRELLFNKLASEAGFLNKSSCFAAALGVTKFTIASDMPLATLCCAA
jgi:hypothetical protein